MAAFESSLGMRDNPSLSLRFVFIGFHRLRSCKVNVYTLWFVQCLTVTDTQTHLMNWYTVLCVLLRAHSFIWSLDITWNRAPHCSSGGSRTDYIRSVPLLVTGKTYGHTCLSDIIPCLCAECAFIRRHIPHYNDRNRGHTGIFLVSVLSSDFK